MLLNGKELGALRLEGIPGRRQVAGGTLRKQSLYSCMELLYFSGTEIQLVSAGKRLSF